MTPAIVHIERREALADVVAYLHLMAQRRRERSVTQTHDDHAPCLPKPGVAVEEDDREAITTDSTF
jgi:hypothetical protein